MLVIAVLLLWFGGVGARLVYLQINEHDRLRQKALSQRTDVEKSRMLRGTIYDRDERMLAVSVRTNTLYADATVIEDVSAAAKAIGEAALGFSAKLRCLGLDHRGLVRGRAGDNLVRAFGKCGFVLGHGESSFGAFNNGPAAFVPGVGCESCTACRQPY